ncbi:MAG TPA: membrane protein insertase YidC [Acetobacteraceae bacterium]|nr:membrane protein insertase YidC [Acetobacteraceae bacterium]
MDQTRLFLAIAVSIAILIVSQVLLPHPPPRPVERAPAPAAQLAQQSGAPGAPPGLVTRAAPAAKSGPQLAISAPAVEGSFDLQGARLDRIVLRDYRESVAKDSPLVQLLSPVGGEKPYYVQFGWSAAPGEDVKLPDENTVWSTTPGPLSPGHSVTLSWSNGAGLLFRIVLSVDDHYMFRIVQQVANSGTQTVALYPWARVRRDYTPAVQGSYLLQEGPLGVLHGTLHQYSYSGIRSDSKDKPGGVVFHSEGPGGWAGITDKYWLVALVPDQVEAGITSFRHLMEDGGDRYQVDFIAADPETLAPGASVGIVEHVFAGAKVVSLLQRYQSELHIPSFEKAVDFGYFYIVTEPTFFALDFLNRLLGNFGLAIMAFTICLRAAFFPLANKSFKSMSRMRLLQPKMQAIKERLKDEPQRQQQEMMALYKAEGVNPASGCLPMLIQVPVFWALYKVLYITIEMRQAPFFGWIHDLSAQDPTNLFNLFGLIPFNPEMISPFLHIGAWPLIMGCTMFLQQRLNPSPPDPVQARIFLFMPVIFTFMLAHFPVGLVIYYSSNNLLSVGQQWLIMRRARLPNPKLARP